MTGKTIYTPELGEDICTALAEGHSLRKICKQDDMPCLSTVINWIRLGHEGDEKYTAFLAQYLRARELQAELIQDEILDIADDGSNDTVKDKDGNERVNKEWVQRSKLRVDARFRMLERMRPKTQKHIVEHQGKDGGPIESKDVTDSPEEIKKKLAEYGLPTEIYEK